MAKYEVCAGRALRHGETNEDGTVLVKQHDLKAGDTVTLDEEEAGPLLAAGVIALARTRRGASADDGEDDAHFVEPQPGEATGSSTGVTTDEMHLTGQPAEQVEEERDATGAAFGASEKQTVGASPSRKGK